jgi:hypothetical protein
MDCSGIENEFWPDGVEDKPWLTTPRDPMINQQTPPYWTLDTGTGEWVQLRRDGTEICRAPTRRKHNDT